MNHSVKRRRQALHQTHHHYYLNISAEAANLSDWRIESNRKNRFGSENRIESKLFCPNWNALLLDGAEVSVRHFGTSAEMSGHFGTVTVVPKCLRSKVSWVRSVLTPPVNVTALELPMQRIGDL